MRASNGYHPLWQYLECILFLFRLPDLLSIYLVLAVGALLLCGAFVLFARVFTRNGKLSPLFALMPLGGFGLLMAPYYKHLMQPDSAVPLFGAIWNHVDGMESCVTVFAYALVGYFFVRDPEKNPLRFGFSLALLTFARLDHGLFAATIFLAFVWRARKDRWALADAALGFGGPVALYLLINLAIFGSPLPLSGVLKSTWPHPLHSNWGRLEGAMHDPLGTSVWRMYRLAQCVVPVLFTPFVLFFRRGDRVDLLLRATAIAVILLGNYDFWFVDLTAHGHWYFPVSLLFVTLVLIRMIDFGGWFVSVASVAACLYCFFVINDRGNYNTFYGDFFFDEAPKLKKFYGDNQPKILEMDDGIIAFSTHYPCMSGSGLHLDKAGFDAFQKRDLYSLAYARGYDHLATWAYINHPLNINSPPQQVWIAFASVMSPHQLEQFTFKVEYQSERFTMAVGVKK